MTALLPALTGSNVIYGMGMLEMGMTMSYEQLLIDQEIVHMVRRVLQGIPVNKETIGLDVIKSVGANGNYLSQRHTLKYMRSELSTTNLINRKMRDRWQSEGGRDMAEAAREQAVDILKNYKATPLPADVQKTIRALVEEGEAEVKELDAFRAKQR